VVNSYDIKIDNEPYVFAGEGIVLGDALHEPAPKHELGSAVIENVVTGLGPKVNRGNGYYDIHRLIPTVEGQLIFNPTMRVGGAHTLEGTSEYTPGIFHHPVGNAGANYIAYGRAIYAIFLTDIVALTYTNCTGDDPTGAPINNANARYTGGAFTWRNRVYFGIEDSSNGKAIGYAYIDLAVSPTAVTLKDDSFSKAFSYAAAGRGRLFLARNQSNVIGNDPIQLRWSPDMDHDYSDDATPFTVYGDTGTFVYAIENRPRVTWIRMLGSAVIFFTANGGALASDEAGFIGIIGGPSQSSGAEDNFQGFGAVPYLDGLAYRINFGGPIHLNPVTLVTRSFSPGNLQDLTLENNDVTILCMTSVGEHLLYAGGRYLYEVVWIGATPVLHKHMDFSNFVDLDGYTPGAMSYQGGLLVITFVNTDTNQFRQVQMEPMPSINVSTEAVSDIARSGYIDTGILVGPSRATHMTKLWLQVRGTHYTRVDPLNTLSFSNALVDESKVVSIASVVSPGPWAAQISGAPQLNRLGRTLSFRLNMNTNGYTGFNERVFTPIVADFLWVPTEDDMLTLKLLASAEVPMRTGGSWVDRSARAQVDALLAKSRTVITVEFSDGSPTPATWTMFVQDVTAARVGGENAASSGYGADDYVVSMVCRRLA
jgi:hypothetical protein